MHILMLGNSFTFYNDMPSMLAELTCAEVVHHIMYDTLASGKPVPFEWAALYGDEWTLHYSLIIDADIPNNKVTVANPYGYYEELTLEELFKRTSFEAYSPMPLFMKMGFAIGMFEKTLFFSVE